jgi:DNA polymerase-3 subunit epsilon
VLTGTPLAFVDVETTGLSPSENRIAEIGVVTVDGEQVDRWTTLLKTSPRRESPSSMAPESADLDDAPFFRDIATELAQRLSGRLLIAHNARFDHAFLAAEFDRVGVAFHPQVVCSVMLSRRLYPHLTHHDLDSLAECHGLRAETRHRALPDADLLWQWWQVIHRHCSRDAIADTVKKLLAGPVLPAHLEPSLIDRLPQSPGAYVFHAENNEPLLVGAAGNLKLHVQNYFRIDRATDKALEYSHRITNITWRVSRGTLGAQLHAAVLADIVFTSSTRKMNAFTWQFSPDTVPSVAVVPFSDGRATRQTESFGSFTSERRAQNALARFATKHRLCHRLLGVSGSAKVGCRACPVDQSSCACTDGIHRQRQLVDLFSALRPLRIQAWPHRGPVGIRERSDMHIVDDWRFLGTARSESELHDVLQSPPRAFDKRLYRLLNRTFARLPQSRIVDLAD